MPLENRDIISYQWTWYTVQDTNVCEACARLSGSTWITFSLEGILEHPTFGEVWNLDLDVSLTHPNCRCVLDVEPIIELENEDSFELFKADLGEWNYMPSNIGEAKTEMAIFEKDLERLKNRLDNTRFTLQQSMLLLRRLNLPPDVEKVISTMIRARMVTEGYVRALQLLMAATAVSGPWGWITAIAALGVSTVTMADLVMDVGGQ